MSSSRHLTLPLLAGLLLFGLAAAGCAPPPRAATLDRLARFSAPQGGQFRIEYGEEDEALIPAIHAALQRAAGQVERWGGLRYPVLVRVHPDHDQLEGAVAQYGYPWLRAWAQFDLVHLQSPRSWGIRWDEQLPELLTHELTHVAMYQALGGPDHWAEVDIPLWFREGMASVTAGQGYRRTPESEVAERMRREPGLDPLQPGAAELRRDKDLVYSSGHWAFHFLLRLQGDEARGTALVREVLNRLREGHSFAQAFRGVWGLSEAEFRQRWREHLGLEDTTRV